MDKESTFEDLLQVVEKAVSVMSTEYGQIMFSPSKPSPGEGYRHHRVGATHNGGTFTNPSLILPDRTNLRDLTVPLSHDSLVAQSFLSLTKSHL